MATQPPPMPSARPSGGTSALKIIGIIFLLLVLICGGCVTYLVINARSLVTGALEKFTTEMISQSELPQEQKDHILKNVNAIATAVRNKDVSLQQVGTFIEKLTQSNFMNLIVVEAVEAEYMTKVQPDESRKAEVEMVFTRFKRGIVEEFISPGQVDKILNQVANQSGEQIEMKQDLTAEDLESVVQAMKQVADEANIPDEAYQVDYAAILNDVMAEVFPELTAEINAESSGEELPAEEETAPTE